MAITGRQECLIRQFDALDLLSTKALLHCLSPIYRVLMVPKSCNQLSIEPGKTGAEARRQAIFSTGVAGLR